MRRGIQVWYVISYNSENVKKLGILDKLRPNLSLGLPNSIMGKS